MNILVMESRAFVCVSSVIIALTGALRITMPICRINGGYVYFLCSALKFHAASNFARTTAKLKIFMPYDVYSIPWRCSIPGRGGQYYSVYLEDHGNILSK